VSHFVIDASVAIKWIVEEEGTFEALAILEKAKLSAPDLLIAECANILWKKVRREELSEDEAQIGARLLEQADIEILPTRHMLGSATSLAVELDHPAYDCIYLALAVERDWQFATADERFQRRVREDQSRQYSSIVLSLPEAAATLTKGGS
jgi:predicted nucleic acid-binding protein